MDQSTDFTNLDLSMDTGQWPDLDEASNALARFRSCSRSPLANELDASVADQADFSLPWNMIGGLQGSAQPQPPQPRQRATSAGSSSTRLHATPRVTAHPSFRQQRARSMTPGRMTATLSDFANYPVSDGADGDAHDGDIGEPSPAPTQGPLHKRGYQACNRCRDRKTKCVPRGTEENPLPGDCKRCTRERQICTFEPTRKKRKTISDASEEYGPQRRPLFDSPQSNNVAGLQTYPSSITSQPAQFNPNHPNAQAPYWSPSTQGTTTQNLPTLENATTNGNRGGAHIRSEVATESLRDPSATTQDNIQMLVRAAMAGEKNSDLKSPPMFGSPLSATTNRARTFSNNTLTPGRPGLITADSAAELGADVKAGILAWQQMRFVRAGWFTAIEALQYVEYFFDKMAPMTPIVIPEYRSPAKHLSLLTDEPVLAIAILAIASRHLKLEGYAGTSRSYRIHDKLWTYLRQMLERLLWAQEQFGGGFCGAGASARVTESTCGQLTWQGSLRTLGTIEAILLLTDWQPQALHFPPGDDENRLIESHIADLLSDGTTQPNVTEVPSANEHTSLPFASWLEPSWRSDRMSWMLLGLAQALSFELGVFDQKHYDCRNNHDPASDCARKMRVRRLVLVYVSQNSGRLGIPSSLPLDKWKTDEVYETTSQLQRKNQPEDPVDLMQTLWLKIANIMYDANQQIFSSRQFTRDLTASGQYLEAIDSFRPKLLKWKSIFEKLSPQIQPLMRYILTMEYEYARMYINSLGLQKVVESFVGRPNGEQSSADYLQATYRPNAKCIDEVTDASRNILTAVVDGLAPGGHIKNAPTRIFTRALSGMLFALKRFSIGAYEQEVRKSLDMLDRATEILGNNAVDDVHLVNQTSHMIAIILDNIKKTFIRVHPPTTGSEAASRDGSRQQTPNQPHDQESHKSHTSARHSRAPSSARPLNVLRSDALAAIPGHAFSEISNTFMPPLNYNFQTNGTFDDNIPLDPTIDMPGWNDDWIALPLDGFQQQGAMENMTVDQGFGGIGPTVGDRDMLEIITNQQYNQQWSGFPGAYTGGFQQR